MMALFDHKFGRFRPPGPGISCRNGQLWPMHGGISARMPQLGLDSGVAVSVLFNELQSQDRVPMEDQRKKQERLREAGTLNRTPEKVREPAFAAGDFFDSRDLLQVRYEMVRLVRKGGATLAQAAERFGVSRPTCFRMVKSFERGGLQGLIPAKRGPRGPHKITAEMLRFVEDYRERHGRVGARRLVRMIEAEFGVRVHPRGLEKALGRDKKKSQEPGP